MLETFVFFHAYFTENHSPILLPDLDVAGILFGKSPTYSLAIEPSNWTKKTLSLPIWAGPLGIWLGD